MDEGANIRPPTLSIQINPMPVQKRKNRDAFSRFLSVTPLAVSDFLLQARSVMISPSSLRVAIIEDHQMLRELIVPILRDDLGYTLTGAVGSVAEGLTLCRREKPDLVIADWMLPDGRGFDVLRGTAPFLPNTRWLFMSSNENGHLIREAVALRVHGFVMKRGALDTLRTAIREVAAGRTYYCPESSRLLVHRLVDEGLAPANQLTLREVEVLRAFARGDNLKAIADHSGASIRTVQNHLSAIREKLDLHEPAELVHYALRHGLVEPS